jgi:hypothetical protein
MESLGEKEQGLDDRKVLLLFINKYAQYSEDLS